MRQRPEEREHLLGHDAVLVVFGQAADQLQQLLSLLRGRGGPRALQGEWEREGRVGWPEAYSIDIKGLLHS